MKRCVGCANDLPLARYAVKARWPDGSGRSLQSRCVACLAEQTFEQRSRRLEEIATGCPVDAEKQIRLMISPWRDWIEAEISRLEAWAEHQLDPAAFLAIRMDVDPRRLHAWRYTTRRVELDLIDSACCAMGETRLLRELYPELWIFDEGALAA